MLMVGKSIEVENISFYDYKVDITGTNKILNTVNSIQALFGILLRLSFYGNLRVSLRKNNLRETSDRRNKTKVSRGWTVLDSGTSPIAMDSRTQ